MTDTLGDFLLVRTGDRQLGLPLDQVLEVGELGPVYQVPSHTAALRGVTPARGRLVPLVHLGALVSAGACPAERCSTVVLASFGGRQVGLEVDEADVLTRASLLPVPPGESIPWALAVVSRVDGYIPILNLDALAERLEEVQAKC